MAKAEAEPTNITQLRPPDPTNAERQRRHRAQETQADRYAQRYAQGAAHRYAYRYAEPQHRDRNAPGCACTRNLLGRLQYQRADQHLRWRLRGWLGVAFELGKLSAVAWLGQR